MEIKSGLFRSQLILKLKQYYKEYEGKVYRHVKTGGKYIVVDTCTIEINGKGYYSVVYCPYVDGITISEVRHCRPIHEFTDGRMREIV